MKVLYLFRHAKSSWDNPDLDDFDRPLNERGEKDAPRMGKRMKEREFIPNMIYSSPAARALTTAKTVASIIGFNPDQIVTDKKLYHASEDALLNFIQKVPDHFESAMLFGHNPGLTEFAGELLGDDLGNIPTAGVVGIRFKTDSWKPVKWGNGKLLFFDYPKQKD